MSPKLGPFHKKARQEACKLEMESKLKMCYRLGFRMYEVGCRLGSYELEMDCKKECVRRLKTGDGL